MFMRQLLRRILNKLKQFGETFYPLEEQARRAGVNIGSDNFIFLEYRILLCFYWK